MPDATLTALQNKAYENGSCRQFDNVRGQLVKVFDGPLIAMAAIGFLRLFVDLCPVPVDPSELMLDVTRNDLVFLKT